MLITFSAPIRFASKVEISIAEVKTYPEMYLMSSGYSSGKSYAGGHDFQKVKIFENFRKFPKKIEKWLENKGNACRRGSDDCHVCE